MDDVGAAAAVVEEGAHGIPEVETIHGLCVEGLAELIEARDKSRLIDRSAACDADESGGAGANALNRAGCRLFLSLINISEPTRPY